MIPQGFVRVSKGKPCPVCSKHDWCLVTKDGSAAICPRSPSNKQVGDAGFLHRLSESFSAHQIDFRPREVVIDADQICTQYQSEMKAFDYAKLSIALGVSIDSLVGIGTGKAVQYLDGTYSFPMRDDCDRIIGVRLRNADGHKWAVYGSKSGLFYGSIEPNCDIYICEGPTDTAALMDWGFCAIGKPSCNAGNDYIVSMLKKLKPGLVVVVSDVDGREEPCKFCTDQHCQHCKPGQVGAEKTAKAISAIGISVKIIEPINAKDARQWKQLGASKKTVLSVVANTPCFLSK